MSNHRNPDILLGDKRIPIFDAGAKFVPSLAGFVWICPYCGNPWARMEGTSTNTRAHPWHIISWPCLAHTSPSNTDILRGGTVLSYLLWFPERFGIRDKQTFLESISRELINYEAFVRCEQILKDYS